MSKILVDTNVLIYSLDKNSRYHLASISLLSNPNYSLYVSTKNISEFVAVATKQKVEYSIITEFLAELPKNVKILFPDHKSLKIFYNLFHSNKPVGNKVYDMEIVSVMIANKIPTIATFNPKDFVEYEDIEILN